jgi:hypothetical protein
MPIFFMALIALGTFLVMGLMLFYAAYAETRTERQNARRKLSEMKPELKSHAPTV